jgi:hypothetical protein
MHFAYTSSRRPLTLLPLAEWPKLELPDVVVVKKVYAAARRRNRMWKLRSIIKEVCV